MISHRLLSILAFTISFGLIERCPAQSPSASDDAVRVTVSLNADGSRTVYQFDNVKHEAIATTTEADGKPRNKIIYQVGEDGKFASGVFFGADGKFQFKSIYKYDAAGRLEQETRLAKDDSVLNRVLYKYDSKGKQVGYSIVDPDGRVVSGTAGPTQSPSKARNALSR
jgi:hypothetical protein